jgi:uncharacterized protein YndB with AHSA1/START domain
LPYIRIDAIAETHEGWRVAADGGFLANFCHVLSRQTQIGEQDDGESWKAITDTEMRRKYNFGAVVTSDWTTGSLYEGVGGGMPIFEGENLEVDPPRRLVQSFRALWGEDVKSEGTSRVTWEIEPVGDSCLLKVTHDQLREDANNQLYGGWPMVLSGIKTLLETGEILTTPGSLRWLQGVKEQLPEVVRSKSR